MPLLGSERTAQARALTRNQTGNLLLRGMMSNPLSHTSQGLLSSLYAKHMGPKGFYSNGDSSPRGPSGVQLTGIAMLNDPQLSQMTA